MENLSCLSLADIMLGLVLFSPADRFTDQDVYRVFKDVDPTNRFRVRTLSTGELCSEIIRDTLSFFEMGYILLPISFERGLTYYLRNREMILSLRRQLEGSLVLPMHEETLIRIAAKLQRNLHNARSM